MPKQTTKDRRPHLVFWQLWWNNLTWTLRLQHSRRQHAHKNHHNASSRKRLGRLFFSMHWREADIGLTIHMSEEVKHSQFLHTQTEASYVQQDNANPGNYTDEQSMLLCLNSYYHATSAHTIKVELTWSKTEIVSMETKKQSPVICRNSCAWIHYLSDTCGFFFFLILVVHLQQQQQTSSNIQPLKNRSNSEAS